MDRGSAMLAAERWPGNGQPVVLLHAGVADRRGWRGVAEALQPRTSVVAYDMRGYGETTAVTYGFTHLDDLRAVLDRVATGPVWLVGSSMGGEVAIDAALSDPERVAGLVLLAPAVSGAPEPMAFDPHTERLIQLWEAAQTSGDIDEINRIEMWLWLDGPSAPEGRVSGPARTLALAMNAVALKNEIPEESGKSGLVAWSRTRGDQRAGDGRLRRPGPAVRGLAVEGALRLAPRLAASCAARGGAPALSRGPRDGGGVDQLVIALTACAQSSSSACARRTSRAVMPRAS